MKTQTVTQIETIKVIELSDKDITQFYKRLHPETMTGFSFDAIYISSAREGQIDIDSDTPLVIRLKKLETRTTE